MNKDLRGKLEPMSPIVLYMSQSLAVLTQVNQT